MSHQSMKISVKRRFSLNILTIGGVGGIFGLTDAVQLTAGDAQIGGNPIDEYVVCNVRSHAKSGIHEINHCPNYKSDKEYKKTSANCYWQPPLFAVIMLKPCTYQSANDNQC